MDERFKPDTLFYDDLKIVMGKPKAAAVIFRGRVPPLHSHRPNEIAAQDIFPRLNRR